MTAQREPFILNPATRRRVVNQVAMAAHACWRARRAQARSRGADASTNAPFTRVDADSAAPSTADVPFSKLSPEDREYLCRVIVDDDLLREIARAVAFPQRPDRPMSLREIYKGKPIAFRAESEPTTALPADPNDLGEIIAWEPERESVFPRSITVRWSSGEVTTHSPFSYELRRVDVPALSAPPLRRDRSAKQTKPKRTRGR